MTIQPSPILRQADAAKNAYRGFAMAQMRILIDYMRIAGLNVYSRVVTLENGVIVTCKKCFSREDIFVDLSSVVSIDYTETIISVSGIILHPRSGAIVPMYYNIYITDQYGSVSMERRTVKGVSGGWAAGSTEMVTPCVFPMKDDDNASFMLGDELSQTVIAGVVRGSATAQISSFVQPGNYGNLYWTNGAAFNAGSNTWDKPPIFLSWRGTPTRHFRLPGNTEIPGFSTIETYQKGSYEDMPVFTSFGPRLYQGGIVLSEAPRYHWPYAGGNRCLILGAVSDAQGVVSIVTHSDHYSAPEGVFTFSDGYRLDGNQSDRDAYLSAHAGVRVTFERSISKGGYYLTLWRLGGPVDGWTWVSEANYGRNGLPWFGNVDGTEFVCGNGDRLTVDGTLTPKASVRSGVYKESYQGSPGNTHWGFHATFSDSAFSEFDRGVPVASAVSFASGSSETSTGSTKGSRTYKSNLGVLYGLKDAQARSGAKVEYTSAGDPVATITCVNGKAYALLSYSVLTNYWGGDYKSYTTLIQDGPSSAYVKYWGYDGPRFTDAAHPTPIYDVAEVWMYGPTTNYWGC